MTGKASFIVFMLICMVLSASCSARQTGPTSTPNIANPATAYCEQNGGKLEFRQDASGGTNGVCRFTDGSECDEWAFFRHECKPGDSLAKSQSAASSTPASSSGPAPARH